MSVDPKTLIARADKKAAPVGGGFLNKVFGGGSSYQLEEAADLYIQAANAYRIQKDGRSAGQTFEKAAAVQSRSEARDDAANTLVEAYKSYRQTDPQDAVRVLEEAIHLFTQRGQFRRAANYQMDLGSVYETELKDLPKAIAAYDNAGDWYYQDQAEALSNKAFLKVADIAALNGDYGIAVEKFERVAKQSLNNNLNKWSLKEYFLKAGICRVAEHDLVAAKRALEQYLEWEPSFATTKEYQLLEDIISSVEEGDEQRFTDKLYEFDQFSKLDKWKVTITLRIKEHIQTSGDDDLL
jgi:alpha-soluble NSF attachment protein